MNNKAIKKQELQSEPQILIKNFHRDLKPPVSKPLIISKINDVFMGEKCTLKFLELNLVNNSTIKRVNSTYLKHDNYTDVITFVYQPDIKGLEGEIFISLDTVKRNAKEFSDSYKNEFLRVLVHGCLHMAGYKDKKKQDIKLMREKENKYINVLR